MPVLTVPFPYRLPPKDRAHKLRSRRVPDIPEVKFGDKVTLIGRDQEEYLPVEKLSELSGRFNYEFVCDLGKRIPRVYVQDGKVEEQVDYFA